MHSISLIQTVDAFSFAPAQVGTLVRVIRDVSANGDVIWYQKQYRDEKEDYLVWRRVEAPEPTFDYGIYDAYDDDPVTQMLGQGSNQQKLKTLVESEMGSDEKLSMGRVKIRRVWEDEV